jgi:hypothetical protein
LRYRNYFAPDTSQGNFAAPASLDCLLLGPCDVDALTRLFLVVGEQGFHCLSQLAGEFERNRYAG